MNGEVFTRFDAGACRELLIVWNQGTSLFDIIYHDLFSCACHVVQSSANYQVALETAKAEVEKLRDSKMSFREGCSLHSFLGKHYLSPQKGTLKKVWLPSISAWLYKQVTGRDFTLDELSDLIQEKNNWTHTFAFVRAQEILNGWVLSDIVIR